MRMENEYTLSDFKCLPVCLGIKNIIKKNSKELKIKDLSLNTNKYQIVFNNIEFNYSILNYNVFNYIVFNYVVLDENTSSSLSSLI